MNDTHGHTRALECVLKLIKSVPYLMIELVNASSLITHLVF
jgi:hypothetical protein